MGRALRGVIGLGVTTIFGSVLCVIEGIAGAFASDASRERIHQQLLDQKAAEIREEEMKEKASEPGVSLLWVAGHDN